MTEDFVFRDLDTNAWTFLSRQAPSHPFDSQSPTRKSKMDYEMDLNSNKPTVFSFSNSASSNPFRLNTSDFVFGSDSSIDSTKDVPPAKVFKAYPFVNAPPPPEVKFDFAENFVKVVNEQVSNLARESAASSTQLHREKLDIQKMVDDLTSELERLRDRLHNMQLVEEAVIAERELWKKSCNTWKDMFNRLAGNDVDGLKIEELDSILEQQKLGLSRVEKAIVNRVDRLKEEKLCHICMDNEKNILLFPCKHFKICEACSLKDLKMCPFCNCPIESTLKLFP